MKLFVRTVLASAVAAGALAAAVAPASAAVSAEGAHAAAGAQAVVANPKAIKAAAYNQARSILANAGSQTAASRIPSTGRTMCR